MITETIPTQATEIVLPAIMTANTYFWSPSSSASGRRNNEKRHNEIVARFLAQHADALKAAGITVNFAYSESCNHVYKTFEVYRNGKKSNITALKKALSIS